MAAGRPVVAIRVTHSAARERPGRQVALPAADVVAVR
jgi:hypothetical protein